jgi:hypothetical protein
VQSFINDEGELQHGVLITAGRTKLVLPEEEALLELERQVVKRTNQQLRPTSALTERIYRACRLTDVWCVRAKHDAEELAAQLSARGHVDIVMTEDSDALPWGARFVWRMFGRSDQMVDRNAAVKSIGLSERQFVELCVLAGTDFNNRIRNFGIQTAYSELKRLKTLRHVVSHLFTTRP